MARSTVADLGIDEFKDLVREVVARTIAEALSDPDEGLDVREDLRTDLQQSLATVQSGGETIPAGTVAARLGLEW